MRAVSIIYILAAIISCTLAQDPTSLPNYKPGWHRHRTPQSYSSQVELPTELPPNAKSYHPTSVQNWDMYSGIPKAPVYKPVFGSSISSSSYPRGYKYAANPEIHSYQWELPPEVLLRNSKNYYPTSGPVLGSSRYAANPDLYSYQLGDIFEVQDKLIKHAEQLNARLEETHQLMMKNFDKEKQILRAASETETTTEDKV